MDRTFLQAADLHDLVTDQFGAWLQMRFGEAYPVFQRIDHAGDVALDGDRLEFYRYAQVLSLIEGPLRIADTDFPDRDWMLRLAEWNIDKALAGI
jgi:hypothetical protein